MIADTLTAAGIYAGGGIALGLLAYWLHWDKHD